MDDGLNYGFQENTQLKIGFSESEKEGITKVLAKFPSYNIARELLETIRVPGVTVLTAAEALVLAGLIRHWYSFLADRLTYHPAIWIPAVYFPLRLDTDPKARRAAMEYVRACREEDPDSIRANDLERTVRELTFRP